MGTSYGRITFVSSNLANVVVTTLNTAASPPCVSRFLLHMVKEYPEQLLQVDRYGRTVLSLALESGHSMVESRLGDRSGRSFCNKSSDSYCIRKLVDVDFRSLGLQDPKTGLFPFQTAASMEERLVEVWTLDDAYIRGDREGISSVEEERMQRIRESAPLVCLNTIYFLLRTDPSALSSAAAS